MFKARRYMPAFFAIFSLLFVTATLVYEYFGGGVQSHHLLDRSDLPAISNWFGLVILPLLGWLLDIRIRNHQTSFVGSRVPPGIWIGLVCALLYGAVLAASFELGPSALTSGMFIGMFLLAAILPIYRVEFILGFVVGMTFTFGAILPTLVAAIFAAVSFVLRFVFRKGMSAMRRPAQPPGTT